MTEKPEDISNEEIINNHSNNNPTLYRADTIAQP